MSAYSLENEIVAIARYKSKMFQKLMSLEAQLDLLKRSVIAGDVRWFYTLWQSYMELIIMLVLAVEYTLGLTEYTLLHAEWDVDYPTIDELVRGIYIHLIDRTLEDVFRLSIVS